MTVAELAQNRSDTNPAPLDVADIAPEALYGALRRLTAVAGLVLAHVDRSSADVHKDLERLRDAHAAAKDVLYPPPPPESPDDVVVRYAHAVREGDVVWDATCDVWLTVVQVGTYSDQGGRKLLRIAGRNTTPLEVVDPMTPLMCRPRPEDKEVAEA